MNKIITGNLKNDEKVIDAILHINESFDVLKKRMEIGGKTAVAYYINGFCDNDMMEKLHENFCR